MNPLLPSVIVLGVAGVATLLALGLLFRGIFGGYPAAPLVPACARLNRKEQAVVAACADTLFPPGGPIPLSGTEAGAVRYFDNYLGGVSATQRRLIRLLLHAVEHSPWLFGPARRVRFTRLSAAERVAVLEAMGQSPIYLRRVMFVSLRVILTMGYLANEEVARTIGVVAERAPFDGMARGPRAASGDLGDEGRVRSAERANVLSPGMTAPREVPA